jgi:uncharacterized protein YjbI with pentapeptide repeats
MKFSGTAKNVAGMVLSVALVGFSLSTVQAEDVNLNGIDDAATVSAQQPVEISSVDTTVAVEKEVVVNSKKKSSKKTKETIIETLPGEKLTIRQVMTILKTTRDLSGKNLSGLQLIGINLAKSNLKGIDLSNANLERADLGESDLERADLTGANLKMSNLRLSGMTGTKIERAILDGAIWKDGMVCSAGSVGQCREIAATSVGK